MEMRVALDQLRTKMELPEEIVVVGGGSRSRLWRQIYADVYEMRIVKTNIDQQAAALGAAALAAVAEEQVFRGVDVERWTGFRMERT